MKILDLPLKKEWFNMIESGEKREEYRDFKPYWLKRLAFFNNGFLRFRYNYKYCHFPYIREIDNVDGYTHVRFRYGYTKRTMLFKIDEITLGLGNPLWGAPCDRDVFIIKFH